MSAPWWTPPSRRSLECTQIDPEAEAAARAEAEADPDFDLDPFSDDLA